MNKPTTITNITDAELDELDEIIDDATKGRWEYEEDSEGSLKVTAGTASTQWTEHVDSEGGIYHSGRGPSVYNTTDLILEHDLEDPDDDNYEEDNQLRANALHISTFDPVMAKFFVALVRDLRASVKHEQARIDRVHGLAIEWAAEGDPSGKTLMSVLEGK